MSYTPGPWRAIKWTCHLATTVVVDEPSALTGKHIIADLDTEDNARLVAAAPWLLAECRAARRMLQRVFDLHTEWVDDGQGDSRSVAAAICSLDAAIAKAMNTSEASDA